MKRIIIYIILVNLLFTGCKNSTNSKSNNNVKNIILLIGDGMGLAQLYAAHTANKGELNTKRCNYIGIQTTYSANKYITDSGASGTAIACGKKTNNGMIGVSPDSVALTSILELAEYHNLSTGLVATSTITHATPAAFYAHQPYRKNEHLIALDLLQANVDFFAGGGIKYFNNRADNKNLLDSLKNKSYQIVRNIDELKQIETFKIAGFFAENAMPKISENRGDYLQNVTENAIRILSKNKKGFFLMIEGSQIDWAGHNNDLDYVLNELLDFDKAVGIALDFAEKNKNTLVIVTADHETGGMSIKNGNIAKGEIKVDFTSNDHTGIWVPVYAYGQGSENFTGFYENTDLFYKMKNAFGF